MLSENDKQTLIRNLNRNQVVLFAGAGFSIDAKNASGEPIPMSDRLSKLLWNFIYDQPYDDKTNLKSLYEAALYRKGKSALRQFLRTQLHITSRADWYQSIRRWFWHRIYTTNADDLIEEIYSAPGIPQLQKIIAPAYFQDRDQFLRTIQLVKLHGCINDDSKDLTFGAPDYGTRAAGSLDVWYMHFVADYSTLPTLFVGTKLDEPLFWQYLELRTAQKHRDNPARRPKSFLVAPSISKPDEDRLKRLGIVAVGATAEEFFSWLSKDAPPFSREDIIRQIDPSLEPALVAVEKGLTADQIRPLEYFYSVFKAPPRIERPRTRSLFLLGSPPTWDDIERGIDAQREINGSLKQELRSAMQGSGTDILLLTSAAGGGKSTIAKRVAVELTGEGFPVFFSEGDTRPNPDLLASFCSTLDHRILLIFDNVGHDFSLVSTFYERVRNLEIKPLILLVARYNEWARGGYHLAGIRSMKEIRVPDLTGPDIDQILVTLETNDLLGELRKMDYAQRVDVFRRKARKQILVAMREATSGRGFDDIIRDEFATVEPADARLLYLVAAIASTDNYGLSTQQMITTMALEPAETLSLIETSLAGILVPKEGELDSYVIRHPAIADFILTQASREILAESFIAFLRTIFAVLPEGRERRWSRAFRVYRHQINHKRLQHIFGGRTDLVRNIYEGIKQYFRDDGHYWLQYGSFELEYGLEIGAAENYINQAAAIMPNNPQVVTANAHLLFKKSAEATTSAAARELMEEATTVLKAQMVQNQHSEAHPFHIYGSQMMSYIGRWVSAESRSEHFRRVHDELRQAIPAPLASQPEFKQLLSDLKRAELETAVVKR